MRHTSVSRLLIGLGLALALAAAEASAQPVAYAGRLVSREEAAALSRSSPPAALSVKPAYGTSSSNVLAFGPCDAIARSSHFPIESENCDIVGSVNTGFGSMAFPIHLPTGTLIHNVTIYYFDNDPAADPSAGLYRIFSPGGPPSVTVLPFPAFSGGLNTVSIDLPTPVLVDDAAGAYAILVLVNKEASGEYSGLLKVEVRYSLQVSPDPLTATFTDVPVGHPQHRFVEALVAAGITAGCGSNHFCPDQPVTRGQMAVFLSVALGLYWPN